MGQHSLPAGLQLRNIQLFHSHAVPTPRFACRFPSRSGPSQCLRPQQLFDAPVQVFRRHSAAIDYIRDYCLLFIVILSFSPIYLPLYHKSICSTISSSFISPVSWKPALRYIDNACVLVSFVDNRILFAP